MSGQRSYVGEVIDFDREAGTITFWSPEEGVMTVTAMTNAAELFESLEQMRAGWSKPDASP